MNKAEFEKWVKDMLEEYHNIDKNILIKRFGDKTYIAYNCKTSKTAISRCHPNDEFRQDIGIAIAYARCKGIEVPKIMVKKKLSEMKYGEKFIDESGKERYFIGKNPGKSRQYITLRIVDNHAMNCYDKTYEMVE